MKIGIVGLPNVGKSTLFQAITKKQVSIANYPFCTIEPNVGCVAVPDKRVDKLADLTKSAKKIYATVEFVDIAGLVKGAHEGEGLGNKFLSHIREVDAIVYILRLFPNASIINTRDTIDPIGEKEILDTELILKDLETAEKAVGEFQKDSKSGSKEAVKKMSMMTEVRDFLREGKILAEKEWNEEEKNFLKNYQFLTMKQRIYLLNGTENKSAETFIAAFKKNNWPYLVFDILSEFEAADFSPEERKSFDLPEKSQLDLLIKKCYELLDLITFLTTGPDETRAWTIKKGAKAPEAGRAIHTDFEEKFIRAEVINWQTLLDADGFAKAREKGLIRTEGKNYTVSDGDVIEFKI